MLLLLIFPELVMAQNSAKYAYTFLNEPVSARVMALGGSGMAIYDEDITMALFNPSLINDQMNNAMAFSYVHFFDGINYGQAQYAKNFSVLGSFLMSVQYLNYGQFKYASENGTRAGTFNAADYALAIGWGRELDDHFSIGATARLIYSGYEMYSSFGFSVDVAGTYRNDNDLAISLVASNIGTQLKGYLSGVTYPLPFKLALGFSKKMEHAPFRFTLLADHLEKWDLTYDNPINPIGTVDLISGDTIPLAGISGFADQLMRHIIVGTELILGKNVVLRVGYNYRRRKEMSLSQRRGLVGFSWGFGIHIHRFEIEFARSTYHVAGTPNYFTLKTNIGQFMRQY